MEDCMIHDAPLLVVTIPLSAQPSAALDPECRGALLYKILPPQSDTVLSVALHDSNTLWILLLVPRLLLKTRAIYATLVGGEPLKMARQINYKLLIVQ